MSEELNFHQRKYWIFAVAIIVSVVLYLAGVYSGLYANTIVKEETGKNISTLKQETTQNLQDLQNYVTFLERNLRNMQLEQTFMETLTPQEMCQYSNISFNQLFSQLRFYWERLPFRLEEYERQNQKLPDEYLRLKEEYAQLTIRIWILAKNQHTKCQREVIYGLHFYDAHCEQCVAQGRQIEAFGRAVSEMHKDIVMFPLDFTSSQSIVTNLKTYYGINATPAIIINDRVLQGRLFSSDELMRAVNLSMAKRKNETRP